MPTNTESLNRELFRLLSKYKPKPLDAEGKATPVPDEADVFKFEFTKDGEDYGTVYVTLDDERVMTVYFGDDVSDSPDDKTPGLDYDDTWSGLLHQLSAWRMTKGLRGFKTQNKDRVGDDMARRNHMRNKDKIAEGYYPMGKSRSYSDAVPSVKIVIEHSRVIEEGEQRYRNINRIFLENQAGERYLLDTKKPGIARVYARHIAEGGKVNDDRWSHIGNLCEEYQKMAGFVRATRNGQFNESAQALVNEGLEHYQSLRESLSRMTGKRGYNAYFESWTPPLMEDGTEENNLNELFVQETLDPRIESVMPILNRIHKKVSESIVDKEVNKLAEWADSLVEDESIRAEKNPGGIPEGETSTHKGGTVTSKNGVTQHKSGPGVYGGYDASRHPDSPEEKHVNTRGATTGHRTDKVVKRKELDEFDIDTLNQLASHPMAGPLAAAGGAAIGATIGKGITKAADWYKNRQEKKAQDHDMRGNKVAEEVDLGQYDAVKPISNSGTTPEQEKEFRKKVQAYGKELDQRQKEKAEKTDEDLDANQKRVGQLGPTEPVGKNEKNLRGKLVGGANENFINQADQAVTTEEDEADPELALDVEAIPGMDEGEHTQHAMRGRNPGANEFEHDFENDKIGDIHDKISKMLKKLAKSEHETQTDTDESVAGEFAGGTAGALVGGALGAGIGPVGAAVGSAAGGTAGQMAGRELTKEEQLNEFAPLIAAGARLILPALARVGPILGRMASTVGKAGAEVAGKAATGVGRGAADVAKTAVQSAAQNAGKIGVGAGAYQAITDVANSAVGGVGQIYHDIGSATSAIVQAVGNSIDKATIAELATAAVKYAIPVGILLALLYGGKKLLDQVMSSDAQPAPAGAVREGQEDLDAILRIIRK